MSHQRTLVTPSLVVKLLLFVVGVPFLPLLISQRWDWWEAWVCAIVGVLGFVISRALAATRHPDLLAERARSFEHEDTVPWDKVLSPLVGLGVGLIPFVAGLDERLGWSPAFSLFPKLVALTLILLGYALGTYALMENRFFSGVVRIQTERGHKVVSSGPYRWVRHPGYAGALVTYLGWPVFLDSAWASLPAVALTAALVVRTALEDGTLQDKLDGYRDYAQDVRYRLAPGVW